MKKDIIKLVAVGLILFVGVFLLKLVGIARTSAEAAEADSKAQHLTYVTPDGLTLHAWLTEGRPDSLAFSRSTGVALLLPMMAHTHDSYEPFAAGLREKGYTTIIFDLRGHGLSTDIGGDTVNYSKMSEKDFARLPEDIESFFLDFKTKHPKKYAYNDVVVIGASIGANTAGLLLDRKWVSRAVLLSPGKNYRSLEPGQVMSAAFGGPGLDKPVYIVASVDDSYSAESSQWLFDQYKGPKVFKKYPGDNHGTDILHNVKDADKELLDWMR